MNIIKYFIEKKRRTINTVKFWKSKGAKIEGGCSIHP